MSTVTEQSGVATSTPSRLRRWFLSKLMTHVAGSERVERVRKKREAKRQKQGRNHVIEYFHQVDDGYSHLAIQVLKRLIEQYDVDLVIHLVEAVRDDNSPEPDLLLNIAKEDAAAIAPYFGLSFPKSTDLPANDLRDLATKILCNMDVEQFVSTGVRASACFWENDAAGLSKIADQSGLVADPASRLRAGAERRNQLKHYGGAMFWYEGEWYWGIDRLHHLETRLKSLGALRDITRQPVVCQQEIVSDQNPQAKRLTLEYYASLRSPYTAVSWEPTLKVARATGVNLELRPVLPMVMRGVPATLMKGFYIFKDAAREARSLNVDYGNFYDPIGEPIKQGYSLYMWAEEQGMGLAFFGSFLKAAFSQGIDTTKSSGMKTVVEMAGLTWERAQHHLEDTSWEQALEDNRLAMYDVGIWGVPSYRLLDDEGKEIIRAWGQDRLWLIARKIQEFA